MGNVTVTLDQDSLLSDQREVLDYWSSLKKCGGLPCLSDFRPASLVKRLPKISLIDATPEGFRYRLAGTGLRERYNIELTGRMADDAALGGMQVALWQQVLPRVIASGEGASGFMPLMRSGRIGLVQAWLRLPLAGRDGRITTILGYDRFLPLQRMPAYGDAEAAPILHAWQTTNVSAALHATA